MQAERAVRTGVSGRFLLTMALILALGVGYRVWRSGGFSNLFGMAAKVSSDTPSEQQGMELIQIDRATLEQPMPTLDRDGTLLHSEPMRPGSTCVWFELPPYRSQIGRIPSDRELRFATRLSDGHEEPLDWNLVDRTARIATIEIPGYYPAGVHWLDVIAHYYADPERRWRLERLPANRLTFSGASLSHALVDGQTVALTGKVEPSDPNSPNRPLAPHVQLELTASGTPPKECEQVLAADAVDFEWAKSPVDSQATSLSTKGVARIPFSFSFPFASCSRRVRVRAFVRTYKLVPEIVWVRNQVLSLTVSRSGKDGPYTFVAASLHPPLPPRPAGAPNAPPRQKLPAGLHAAAGFGAPPGPREPESGAARPSRYAIQLGVGDRRRGRRADRTQSPSPLLTSDHVDPRLFRVFAFRAANAALNGPVGRDELVTTIGDTEPNNISATIKAKLATLSWNTPGMPGTAASPAPAGRSAAEALARRTFELPVGDFQVAVTRRLLKSEHPITLILDL